MGFLDIIFPVNCLERGKETKYLCDNCLAKVGNARLFCLECHKAAIDGATHAGCKKKYSIDFAISAWGYSGVVRKAILKLKYNFAYKIADELAWGFTKKLVSEVSVLPKDALLLPIPLYKSRENWRGFNQSEKMGEIVADKFGWEYNPNVLIRSKKTKPQAELSGRQRAVNLQGVFSLSRDSLKFSSYKLPLVLFDDVLTTGSTLREACKVLKRNGAKTVWGLTIAA